MSSSEKVFEATLAGKWEEVKEIIATSSWAPAELEKKLYGVQRI